MPLGKVFTPAQIHESGIQSIKDQPVWIFIRNVGWRIGFCTPIYGSEHRWRVMDRDSARVENISERNISSFALIEWPRMESVPSFAPVPAN